MTTYTIEELKKECSLLEYCLISAVSKKRVAIMEKIIDNIKTDKDGYRKFDIKLVVNGVDVPLMATFKDIAKQRNRMILEDATELLNERLLDFSDELHEVVEDIKDKMTKILSK